MVSDLPRPPRKQLITIAWNAHNCRRESDGEELVQIESQFGDHKTRRYYTGLCLADGSALTRSLAGIGTLGTDTVAA